MKRELETLFVHKFSKDTMPFENVFKNSGYYWGAGFMLGLFNRSQSYLVPDIVSNMDHMTILFGTLFIGFELLNMYCHYYLSANRTGTEYVLPNQILFKYVVCPNYTFEILSWLVFSLCFQSWATLAFAIVGAIQMYQWSLGKYKRYKKIFGDKYKSRKMLIPFVL